MATQVQYRRGTNAQNTAFTGALGEITVDTTNGTLRVHDAITAGGSNIATVAYVTSQISSLSSNSISFGTSSVAVIASGGNIRSNVAGTTVQTISSGLVAITGDLTVSGNATLSGNILGDRIQNGTTSIDIQTPSGNANISIGGTSNVFVVATTGVVVTGAISATGTVTAASTVGGVITGTSASVSGTVTAASTVGGVITGSSSSVTGAQTAASTVGGVITGSSVSVSGTVTAASTVGGVITGSSVSVSGTVTAASTVGGVLSGSSLTVSTGSITCGSIVNANANAVGNIGSSSLYFNTVFAKATSAQYADLAEMYVADAEYAPGTVVEFGGTAEVTQSTASHSTRVAGIVSTNPSYLMNATLTGDHVVPVALTGRVPCQVTGTIAKGDRLVASAIPGVATRLDPNKYEPACIIGKALETYDSETTGIIEVAVGRT
jgi:hypothetical protein